MARSEKRLYRRTETGRKAWASLQSGLPAAYRRILGLIHNATYCDEVLSGMPDCAARQVRAWLDELETLCFIEALPFASGSSNPPPERKAA